MNVHDIKMKAKSVLYLYRNTITVFIFISLITALANFIGGQISEAIPFVSLAITVLIMPFSHGNVVVALKAVNERGDEVSIEQDGVAGIRRFKDLFGTYFIREIGMFVVMIFVLLFMLVLARITIGSAGIEKIKVLIGMISVNSTNIGAYLGTADMIKLAESLSVVFVVGLILFAVLGCLYSLTFALTPFVLEKYNLKGAKAMSESARLMKGHRWTLVLLYLSYILWFMLTVGIIGLIGGIIPIPLIFDLITAILATYLFGAELNVSLAVFFEEIDYEDKKII